MNIKQKSQQIMNHAIHRLERTDCIDCKFSWSHELIELTQWMVKLEYQRRTVAYMCRHYNLIDGVEGNLRRYFGLRY